MEIVYQLQPNYSKIPPKLTPREVMWIKPQNTIERKLLEALNKSINHKEIKSGMLDNDSLIIYKFL